MPLKLPNNFKNHIASKHTQLIPYVVIGTYDNGFSSTRIDISTESFNRADSELTVYPLLINIPSMKESIDIVNRKYKISSLNLQFSNVEYAGERLSDKFALHNIQAGEEVRLFWITSNSSTLNIPLDIDDTDPSDSDMFQAYYGKLVRYSHDTNKITFIVEDKSQESMHDNIPTKDVGEDAPESYTGVLTAPAVS